VAYLIQRTADKKYLNGYLENGPRWTVSAKAALKISTNTEATIVSKGISAVLDFRTETVNAYEEEKKEKLNRK
jgi:hypothetical protein